MNKSILWLIALLFVTSLSIVSCSETDGTVDLYANWQERNQRYIDSIATVAEANQGNEVGQWKIIRSYKLPDLGLNETGKVNEYVYCKILENGTGTTYQPMFTDSVRVDYRGRLIPLLDGQTVTFDQSYTGDLDLETATPVGFNLSSVVTGWTSALQWMVAGDRWELYIPYPLAYKESGYSSIPGYSTLIFDLYLDKVVKLQGFERSVSDEAVKAE